MAVILDRASGRSASFHEALLAVAEGSGAADARPLTRELLSDLTIRGWIEFCAEGPGGEELPVPRIRNEAQFVESRNWQPDNPLTRYRLTEKGRVQLAGTA